MAKKTKRQEILVEPSLISDIEGCLENIGQDASYAAFFRMAARKLVKELNEAEKQGKSLQLWNDLPIPF